MLARTYRLRKNSDFQKLYKRGKRFATPNLVLYYLPSSMQYSQFGFVVSKKVSKSAVVRNSLRRRLSAVVEGRFKNISFPTQAIVLIRRDFTTAKPTDLQNEVEQLMSVLNR